MRPKAWACRWRRSCAQVAPTERTGVGRLPAVTPRHRRVVVTRPVAEAQRWTEDLRACGVLAESLPLIEIAPLTDDSALRMAWQQVPARAALMFVSANAVQHFMALRPEGQALLAQAWSTGPGTEAALRATGWPTELIRSPAHDAEKFDSEALWALVEAEVRTWAGRSVLIVRGADAQGQLAGRDWLASQLEAAGVQVLQCVAYVRRPPVPDRSQLLRAREALCDGSWWLFSSAEAAQNLSQWLPGAIGPQARALATHPRIAERLRQQGWGRVEQVPATLQEQVASIECLA